MSPGASGSAGSAGAGATGAGTEPGAPAVEAGSPGATRALRSMRQLGDLAELCDVELPSARVLPPGERQQKFEACRRDQRRCASRVGALAPTLAHGDAALRREGARVLGRIVSAHRCSEDRADPCVLFSTEAPAQSICDDLAFAHDALMQAVTDPDPQVGLAALDGLAAAMPRDQDVPALVGWLRQPPVGDDVAFADGFRMGASTALGRAGPRAAPAAEALAELASQRRPNDSVQVVALRALAEVGPGASTVVPTLVGLLDDPSWSVRHAALQALARIAPADPRVREAAQRASTDPNEFVRSAARGLLKAGAP